MIEKRCQYANVAEAVKIVNPAKINRQAMVVFILVYRFVRWY